jgi:hypothetical protein
VVVVVVAALASGSAGALPSCRCTVGDIAAPRSTRMSAKRFARGSTPPPALLALAPPLCAQPATATRHASSFSSRSTYGIARGLKCVRTSWKPTQSVEGHATFYVHIPVSNVMNKRQSG